MGLFNDIFDGLGITNSGAQTAAVERGAAEFAGINLPTLTVPELQQMVAIGEITPEFADIILQKKNAYEQIALDPRLKAQQQQTLEGVQAIAETGMTAQDQADLSRIAAQEAQASRGAREALMQNAQQRGIAGSGMELASTLLQEQESAGRRAARDVEVAGQASQRRMQALQEAGQMAGSMRGQEYGEQRDKAQAQQMIEQFNVENTQAQLAERARAKNAAQAANLQTRQDIANKNVELENQRRAMQANLPQAQFQNQLGLASARAGGQYQMANLYGQQSSQGMGMAGALAGAVGMAMSDKNAKKKVHLAPNEIDDLLESISGYSFKYKDGLGTPGKKVGVMAQDVEEYLPNAVESDPDTNLKVLNNEEILPAVLASVGRLNDRLKKVEGGK